MLKRLFVLIILSSGIPACQTTPREGPTATEAEILESQKAIAQQSLETGNPQAALRTLRPLLRQFPKDAALHSLMGLTQLALRNQPKAVFHLKTAYKLDARTAAGLNLSAAYIDAGDYELATALLNTLRSKAEKEDYPSPERIFHNLGMIAVKQGKLRHAERQFKKALEENPTFHSSHLELGLIYERTRRPALAVQAYRSALDYCRVCYAPLEALANLHLKSGRPLDARMILAQFVQSDSVTAEDKVRAQQLMKIAEAATRPKMRATR